MPQPIAQGQPEQGEADSPSVDVRILTSVVTSTITVQPSGPALNQGPNQGQNSQGSDNNGPGSGPGQGQGPPKSGLQPPPAVMQWVQSMLVNLEVAWMIFYPAAQWVRSRVRRKTPGKPSDRDDDEKPDSAPQADSASQDSEDDAQSGESTAVASTTTVNQAANGSQGGAASVPVKDILHSLIKLTQCGCKPPSGSSC